MYLTIFNLDQISWVRKSYSSEREMENSITNLKQKQHSKQLLNRGNTVSNS